MSEGTYSKKIYDPKKKEKLLNDVLKLTLNGNSPNEIAHSIGKESDVVIYSYQNELVSLGKLEKHTSGRLRIYEVISGNDYFPISKEAFSKIPLIEEYIKKKSLTTKQSQIKETNSHVTRLTVFCNTVNIHPKEILYVKDIVQFLSEKMLLFRKSMDEGTVKYLRPNNVRIRKDSTNVSHQPYARAWASLLESIGKPLPQLPLNHILNRSRRVIGAYSSIALTYKQFREGIDFFKNHEEKYLALFVLMVSIFPRTNAIFTNPITIQIKHTEVDKKSYAYGIIEKWYETKQEHFFSKIIVDPEMIQIVQRIVPNGQPIIKEKDVTKEKGLFNNLLRKFYVSIGLLPEGVLLPMNDPNRPIFKKNTDQYYLDLDPTYALRHTGAILACQYCDYKTNYVSKLGWKNNETLEKYYATIPIEQLIDDVKCHYCNPSSVESDNLYFCRFAHAIAFFNRGHLPKEQTT